MGADAVLLASVLLHNGAGHVTSVIDDVQTWLDDNEYDSVEQMKGSMSMGATPDTDAFARLNYMKMLRTYTSNTH